MSIQIQIVLFIGQILLLYFLSRLNIRSLFYFFQKVTRKDRASFMLIALIYFPGTVLHEMAHFLAATALLSKVRSIQIFPQIQEDFIKLGEVQYEKKDFIRGILIGVAPIFAGFGFFFFLAGFGFFPSANLVQNILFGYLVFVISSTMFSSKKDLTDLIYLIPLIIVGIGIIYVFNIKLKEETMSNLLTSFLPIVKQINFYLFLSLILNLVFLTFTKSLSALFRK